jgi:cell wall-associated NlpC family hydrolase
MIDYINIPFKPMGRDENGVDCYGLVRLFLSDECGIILPRLDESVDVFNNSEIHNKLEQDKPLIESDIITNPQKGDIVIIRVGGVSAHVGVMISNKMLMHTNSTTGVVVESIDSPRIKNRIEEFRRVKCSNTK